MCSFHEQFRKPWIFIFLVLGSCNAVIRKEHGQLQRYSFSTSPLPLHEELMNKMKVHCWQKKNVFAKVKKKVFSKKNCRCRIYIKFVSLSFCGRAGVNIPTPYRGIECKTKTLLEKLNIVLETRIVGDICQNIGFSRYRRSQMLTDCLVKNCRRRRNGKLSAPEILHLYLPLLLSLFRERANKKSFQGLNEFKQGWNLTICRISPKVTSR